MDEKCDSCGELAVKIIGAFHIALFPGWEEIAFSQFHRLRSTGLLDRTELIFVGVVGEGTFPDRDVVTLLRGKARISRHGRLNLFEFPTLQTLQKHAQNDQFRAWYIHTKGASKPNSGALRLRLQMESIVVDNHRACSELLSRFDICGSRWKTDAFGEHKPHFSGNFWWAHSEYLARLPPLAVYENQNRYEAEFWIGNNESVKPFNMPFPERGFQACVERRRLRRDLYR